MLQLKRFLVNEGEEGTIPTTAKIEQNIEVARRLRLKRNNCQGLVSDEQRYELKGIIEHIGKYTNEGHYIAYTLEEDRWTEWNDEYSRRIKWEEVKNKQAYLLFWEGIDEENRNDEARWESKAEAQLKVKSEEKVLPAESWKTESISRP